MTAPALALPLVASAVGAASPLEALGGWTGVTLVFAALFTLSFFFSGSETAFFSLQDLDRRRISEGETSLDRRAHALLQRRPALITTLLMGNETVNIAISTTAAGIVATLFPGRPWVTVAVVTPLLVLLSEITPKVLAFRYARDWARYAAWPLTLVSVALALPRMIVVAIVAGLARLFGVTSDPQQAGIKEEEFLVLVGRGAEEGVVGASERDIIEAVFELDDLPVSRLMTPKPDIFSLPLSTPWEDLLAACQDTRFSRVPIWEDSDDDIIGVLLVKDLLRYRRRPIRDPEQLRALLLEPVYVPGTKPADEMMREAFVMDEHGTLTGLLSLDDLIIELVGEIADEDDDEDEDEDLMVTPEGLRVHAGMDLDDFEEDAGIAVPEGEYNTVAGFVLHVLGRLPEVGDTFVHEGWRFEVAEMDHRRVVRVLVRPEEPAPAAEASP